MIGRFVAVLRPEPGNARTAARVQGRGLTAIRLPLFAVAPLAWSPPDPARYDVLLATSANAFRYGGEDIARLRPLSVVAVGAATADAARAAGFRVEATGEGDAGSLAGAVAGRRALHLAGREHRSLPGVDVVPVYATDSLPIAPARIEALAGSVALLHSPRAAARLAALVAPERRATIRIAALSAAVGAAAGDGWASVAAAVAPHDEALLTLAAELAAATIDRAVAGEDNRGR